MSDTFGYGPKVQIPAADKAAYLEFAKRTARAAGAATLPFFRAEAVVENKLSDGGFDPVTEADRGAERVIREALAQAYPEHGIYGEEFGYLPGNGLTWVIDPIDGTRAFMSGMLHWGVLLGLFDGQEPVLGVMYQPYTDELFAGDNEVATFERGGEVRTMSGGACERLDEAVLATTGVDWFGNEELSGFERLREQARLCRVGGDCYIFALAALGYVHLATDGSLNTYDILPLIPVVRGAGGVITTYDGGDPSMGGTVLAAANPALHAAAMAVIRS